MNRFRFARTPEGAVGVALLAFVLFVALIGPYFAGHSPTESIGLPFDGPSEGLPLGTDGLGRDVLSRVLHGGLTVIGLGIAAAAVSYLGGLTIGLLAGYSRNLLDAGLMRGVDVLLAFPPLLFVLVLVTGAGTSALVLVLAVGIVQITGISRIVRAATLEVSVSGYVEAAVARGEATPAILSREVLPNIMAPVLADFGLRFVFTVLLLSGLSFLSLGVQPPDADWGSLVRENIGALADGGASVIAPSLAIASLTIAVNLVIDNLPGRAARERGAR